MEIQWVDEMPTVERGPGGGSHTKYHWPEVAAKLRERPGRWALIYEDCPRAHAGAIRAGLKPAFQPPEDWLVMTKGPRGSRADLYMVFVGAPGAKTMALRRSS
jgi:hypothetical protein